MSVKAVTTVSIAAALDLLAEVVDGQHARASRPGRRAAGARSIRSPSVKSRVTSSSSSVRTGPVYLFFADTAHQIATSTPTTSTSGV